MSASLKLMKIAPPILDLLSLSAHGQRILRVAAQGFAVKRDDLSLREFDLRIDPLEQTAFELSRINHAQDTSKVIVRRNAVGVIPKIASTIASSRCQRSPSRRGSSAPQITAHKPMMTMSIKRRRLQRSMRGSGKSEKQSISVGIEILADIGGHS
jgi:hypothetical protein